MLIFDGVVPLPIGSKSKKYGEFGLGVCLSSREIKTLKAVLQKQTDIELAFGYFTNAHLEEAIKNNGICYLIMCCEKGQEHSKNNGELEDDAAYLKKFLDGLTPGKSEVY